MSAGSPGTPGPGSECSSIGDCMPFRPEASGCAASSASPAKHMTPGGGDLRSGGSPGAASRGGRSTGLPAAPAPGRPPGTPGQNPVLPGRRPGEAPGVGELRDHEQPLGLLRGGP